MSTPLHTPFSPQAGTPFDATAHGYDREFTDTPVGRMQRDATWRWLEGRIRARQPRTVLEMNCGTGADAAWLAAQGLQVTATDLSTGMVAVTQAKTAQLGVETLPAGILQLPSALPGRRFDLAWSNFGGFNCLPPAQLRSAGEGIASMLNPGGTFAAVVMGRFCAWESLYFCAKLRPMQAFRRLRSGPVSARLADGHQQDTWYHGPRAFARLMPPSLKMDARIPIGAFLPPSYLDPFFSRRPSLLARMQRWEQKVQAPWAAHIADHYLIAFTRA